MVGLGLLQLRYNNQASSKNESGKSYLTPAFRMQISLLLLFCNLRILMMFVYSLTRRDTLLSDQDWS